MNSSKTTQYNWVFYGILSILIMFGVSMLYDPVAALSVVPVNVRRYVHD